MAMFPIFLDPCEKAGKVDSHHLEKKLKLNPTG